jgi:hypothetical protein
MRISAESNNTVTHKNVTLRQQERGSLGRRAWLGISASQRQRGRSPLFITKLRISRAVRHFAWSKIPRKRSHKDVVESTQAHFCQRCRQKIGERVSQSKQLKITSEAWKPIISTMEASQHLFQQM